MSKRVHIAITIFFVALFCIAAPPLLMYTLGYRYSPKRNIIQSTGALSVISIPEGAVATVNGKRLQDTTPLRLTQLLPGSYTLALNKPGYTTWQRSIRIEPGTHAVFAPIRLFARTELIEITNGAMEIDDPPRIPPTPARVIVSAAQFDALMLSPESYAVPGTPPQIIVLWDRARDAVVINRGRSEDAWVRITIPSLKAVEWHASINILILVGANEIARVTLPEGAPHEQRLLTRVAEQITSHLYAPARDAIFYTTPVHLSFVHHNPLIDQEPHLLREDQGLILRGIDASGNRLIINKDGRRYLYDLGL